MKRWKGRAVISHEMGGSRKAWRVDERISFESSHGIVTVMPGLQTDGASIPRWAWRAIGGPFSGRYIEAALIHDGLYAAERLPRKQCDEVFYEAMLTLGVPKWKAKAMYSAVRAGGWVGWNAHDPVEVLAAKQIVSVESPE